MDRRYGRPSALHVIYVTLGNALSLAREIGLFDKKRVMAGLVRPSTSFFFTCSEDVDA
jgi:hypothetical protein